MRPRRRHDPARIAAAVRRLAQQVGDVRKRLPLDTPHIDMHRGVITAVSYTAGTVSLTLAGDTGVIPDVKYLAGLTPRVGLVVEVMQIGDDLVVVGALHDQFRLRIGARIRLTASQSIATGTAATLLDLSTVVFDYGGIYSAGTPKRLTVPQTGLYAITAQIRWANHATGYRKAIINVSGAGAGHAQPTVPSIGGVDDTMIQAAEVTDLSAGDYVELYGVHTAGVNISAISVSQLTWLTVWRVG